MQLTSGNIIAVYFLAYGHEVEEGTKWYQRASDLANRLADKYDCGYHEACGVIAALSPSNRWERNCIDAENLIRVYMAGGDVDALKVATYGRNKQKAIAILNGADIELTLSGPKVTAFYRCIAGFDDSVCIDGHAYNIWMGRRVALDDVPSIGKRLRESIIRDYIDATVRINSITGQELKAHEVQAITWVAWRRMIKEAA
jgi:hypothetical protein